MLARFAPVLCLTGAAFAGDSFTIMPLVLDDDMVEGVGLVTRIDNIAVNNAGTWLVEADTDNPDGDADQVLLRDGELFLREGGPLSLPVGASIGSFDSIVINDKGDNAWNFFLDGQPAGMDSGIYNNLELVTQEGGLTVGIEGLSPDGVFLGFFDVKLNDSMRWIAIVSIDDPEITGTVDRAIIIYEDPGMGTIRTLLAKESDILPGQTQPVVDFGTGPHQSAINDDTSYLFFADLDGPASEDGVIYLYDGVRQTLEVIAQEGDAAPVFPNVWESLASPELDLNNAGDHVFSGNMDGDTQTDQVIAKNGVVFQREGDPSPAANDYPLTSFGTGPVEIDDAGRVLWYGKWDDDDPTVDAALFLDETVLVRDGVTTVDGNLIATVRGVEDGYHMSDDGHFVIFEAVLADGRCGSFLIEIAAAACDADVDDDGDVDVDDLLVILSGWGDCDGCPADVDGNGIVNVDDLLAVIGAWGPCP